jgi:hypothetical protein
MIATRRGLAIAIAIAVVLAGLVLVLDLGRDDTAPDRQIAPSFVTERVAALAWTGGGPAPIRIVRDPRAGSGWVWIDPAGEAEARTVEAVLAALRGARWHRVAEASAAGRTTVVLTVEQATGEQLRVAIGQPLAGADQQWLVVGDRALLVDTWVARALAPEPVTLRLRTPLAGVAQAELVELVDLPAGDLALRGFPRRIVKLAGERVELLAAPELVETIETALAELVVTELPRTPGTGRGLRILLDGALAVADAGPCPGGSAHAIAGPRVGIGCVDEARWAAVIAAAKIPGGYAQLVERRPAPVQPTRITLDDGSVLDLAKRLRIGEHDADPARVNELLAVLVTPGEPVPLPAHPPRGELLVVAPGDFATTIVLYGDGILARRGEPIALRVGEGAYAILARPGRAYRDPTLWNEEPTTIRSLKVDNKTFTRGAVIGEWTGPGRVDAAALEQLAGLLASFQSHGDTAPPQVGRTREIELEIVPPSGPPTRRTLALRRAAGGCAATVNGAHVLVDAQLCVLADQLARS